MTLTEADDRHHEVGDPDPMWTETTWWGLVVPDQSLGGMIYTLLRPNLGVATLLVALWDAHATEPWRVPYHRSQWHIPFPSGELDDIDIGGFRLRCVDPLRTYDLSYQDGAAVALDLRFEGVMDPHVVFAQREMGHFDQLGRLTGTVTTSGKAIAVDALAIRDRSWYVRDDARSLRAGYTYGAAGAGHHFLAFAQPDGAADSAPVVGGYLIRDGQKGVLVNGLRTIVNRRRGHPDEIAIDATDELGRSLQVTGRVAASMASQSTPAMFSWMSIVDWTIDGAPGHGEDHDVWSPDLLARAAVTDSIGGAGG